MTHKITEIKQAIASVLVAANTQVGSRVFVNRLRAIEESELPAIVITFNGASGDRERQEQIRRRGDFSIRILVKDREFSTPDTQAEAILEQVEAALKQNLYVGAAHEELEMGEIRAEGNFDTEATARVLTLAVAVTWFFDVYGVPSDSYLTTSVSIDMSNPRNDPQGVNSPDGQIDAATTFSMPQ